ncbi:MAG: ABC transporter ATP-binding protein [Candidatus Eisenbacteria bacterium]|uniref:ABC transporter ATP-binding protein n=1 Tax=Eiseniibacteriota bacterium TaxID=2212470 RepID=A0A956RQ19_UNCEI|nr:ABC transporter ATP-binding protein [Candidatus Eisenbacteria bacterium]
MDTGTAASHAEESPLIEAIGLSKAYGAVQAVQDLSLSVHRGEILGLLGPNGAGKSTTLRMLIGFQFPDVGEIRLDGRNVFREGDTARFELGYMPEQLPLYAEMPVRSYLGYFARIKGVPSPRKSVERVVERLDLGAVIGRSCGNLSRGYRQRVGLAQALLADPQVLILDEPTSGLDPNQIHDFRELIRGLGRDRAVLLSTHILPEAMAICDRVTILNRGRVVASGTPRDLAAGDSALHWARLRTTVNPGDDDVGRFGLVPEGEAGVYSVQRDLTPEEARTLLGRIVTEGWELLEWHAGAAGLEAVFRRLTLGEESAAFGDGASEGTAEQSAPDPQDPSGAIADAPADPASRTREENGIENGPKAGQGSFFPKRGGRR